MVLLLSSEPPRRSDRNTYAVAVATDRGALSDQAAGVDRDWRHRVASTSPFERQVVAGVDVGAIGWSR